MIHMIEIEAAVAKAGVAIHILDLKVDNSTPSGRLTFNLFGSIASSSARIC
jgi:DNA invertase Pin-like site-specific DNA recombinase